MTLSTAFLPSGPGSGGHIQLEGEGAGKDNAEHGVVPPEEGAGDGVSFDCGRRRLLGRGLACRERWPVNAPLAVTSSLRAMVQDACSKRTILTVVGIPIEGGGWTDVVRGLAT